MIPLTDSITDPCPCGTGWTYRDCCAPWHAGGLAPTAEALMRSRFTAFARRDAAYLIRTSDPATRAKLRPDNFRAAFALTWTRLEIVETADGGPEDATGMVHFRAYYRKANKDGLIDETSRFQRDGGTWVYLDTRGA